MQTNLPFNLPAGHEGGRPGYGMFDGVKAAKGTKGLRWGQMPVPVPVWSH